VAKSWREWMKPLIELEELIAKLKSAAARETDPDKQEDLRSQTEQFEKRRDNIIELMFSRLGAWEEVLLARADPRPYTLDYVNSIFTEFTELDGDRRMGADHAIVAGPAALDGRPVMVVGHQKGRNIQERTYRNFAMAKPEGYRKAIRLMQLADRFGLPVVSLVDTSGAFPGVQAEERGQAEAIARSTEQCLAMGVPMIAAVVGEGGSGGAVAIAAANRVLMFEHAVYSVISPEGCASILWRTADKAADAAEAMKVTAGDLLALGVVDRMVPEPLGGAHRAPAEAIGNLKAAIVEELDGLAKLSAAQILEQRRAKFLAIG